MTPVDVILHCPKCHEQHVDEPHGYWTNPPHKSHLCLWCGCVWRPADVPTNGVRRISTRGVEDSWEPRVRPVSKYSWCLCGNCGPCPNRGAELCYHTDENPWRFITRQCRDRYEQENPE